jgi:23S rRNA pseudouridine1911/1915/1917 synthase
MELPADLTVAPEADGSRLDAWLAAAMGSSRAQAAALVQAGAVLVDGRPAAKSTRLHAGQRVAVKEGTADAVETADVPQPRVVWEDERMLVVDKPARLVVHPAPGHRGTTLVELLAQTAAGRWEPRAVHRLDRDTSGLMLVAKGEPAQRQLQSVLRRRDVEREYAALVTGRLRSQTGTIDAPIGRDRGNRTVMSTRTDRAREAVTHFEVVERLPRTALLRVRLETGRTHQIRAHLAAIGHPVVGDPQYGGSASGSRIGLQRQFLHASTLMFRHPERGEWVRCESKPPVELSHALDTARREPVSGGPDGG